MHSTPIGPTGAAIENPIIKPFSTNGISVMLYAPRTKIFVLFQRLTTPTDKYSRVMELAQRRPEIRECHHVTGGEAFILKVVATSIPHLESLIAQLSAFGATSTSIVLSSSVNKHSIDLAD
jgi:DNA-binding Lrp family transcriptional regulator